MKDNTHHHDHMSHHAMMAADFKKRFIVTLPLAIVILALSPKIQQWFGFSLDFGFNNILLFVLSSMIVFYGGMPFYRAARDELRTRNWGMMTLVTLAVGSGYLFSVAGTFVFPGESFYWEVSTLVLAFLFGHWMEMRAVVGTGGALKELSKLIPPMAHKLNGKKIIDVATSDLAKGDLVLVKPGEKIPADGIVIDGSSTVNESMLTGESRPVAKEKNSEVFGGSINNDGALTIKVTKTGQESALAQISNLISMAQMTKPSVQNLADRAANWLTIIAIVVGTGTFLYWFFINPHGVIFAATLAITVVVITCPHALGLAIPTVTTITTSLAARNGILIRDMKGLEAARDLNYVVFDKTGTLTKGKFGVQSIKVLDKSTSEKELLKLAASVEENSSHSIATSIIAAARDRKIIFKKANKFKNFAGKGAVGYLGKDKIMVGNKDFTKASDNSPETGTQVYVTKNEKLLGLIVLNDEIRKESKEAINSLHKMGIKVAMLTGDKKEVAQEVAKKLNIDTVFSEVLPEDKVNKIKELQKEGRVGMVGDGVNDAPSLTQAHTGIAIGAGTSVAIESAEIVLVKDDPRDVVKAIKLSRLTNRKMIQNLAWATGYNALAIPAAAGVFSAWGILLRPEWGALLMSASSVIVVANAFLLKKAKL